MSASVRNLPGLSLFIPEQSIVKQSLSFLLASSIKSLLSQGAFCGIYLIVFLEEADSKTLRTLGKELLREKYYKYLFEIRLISKLPFLEIFHEKHKHIYFQSTVKKLAKFLDSSARPETSSMAKGLSCVVFSPKILFTLFYCPFHLILIFV